MRFGTTSVTVYAAVTCLTSMLKHASGKTLFFFFRVRTKDPCLFHYLLTFMYLSVLNSPQVQHW